MAASDTSGPGIGEAQRDMRSGYVGGAPGVLVSGLVWLAAASVAHFVSFETSMLALFVGGMLIHPVSVLLARFVLRAPAAHPKNPLSMLALQSTVMLMAGFLLAWVISHNEPGWFYPAMLLVIGSRYFTFATVYGSWAFIALGSVLVALGSLAIIVFDAPPVMMAAAGGAIEVVFALLLFVLAARGTERP